MLWLAAGATLGFAGCYLVVGWRAQAATAYAQLYAVGAVKMADQLDACRQSLPAWPRRR